MTANDIKQVILQHKAVGEATFVSQGGDDHIFAFGNLARLDHANIFHQWCLNEADEEHLELTNVIVFLINVSETLFIHVGL